MIRRAGEAAYRRLTPGIEERQSKCDRWKKDRRGLYEVSQQWRKDVLWPVKL